MAESDAEANALERLEAALDRIAARAQADRPPATAVPAVDTDAVSARLDRLIGQLRGALSDDAVLSEA